MSTDPPRRYRPGDRYAVTSDGSLGLLALGARGINAWLEAQGEPVRRPPANGSVPRRGRRVVLVGWDAADWKVINPLLDAGLMPALESLVNRGVVGNIATLDPPLSPMLWTSIATGMTADRHGVLGFIEPDPVAGTMRPVLGTSRRVKAVWNILNQSGYRSNVIGWWPSHPAEPIDGLMVSNFFHPARAAPGEPWPVPDASVHPSGHADELSRLRIHPSTLTGAHLLPFVPEANRIDQESDKRLHQIAKVLAECASVHAAATYAMEFTDWDFCAVYYDALDHFGHAFMKYHPPRQENVTADDFDIFGGVMTAAYRFHDMMLARLITVAGPDATIIVVSDHGFHSDHLRPTLIPKQPAGPAIEHRPYGVFCMAGPRIKSDERIYGASILDVAPTVLTLFGLPLGQDMTGRPLADAFEALPEIQYVDSWENVDGNDGRHRTDQRSDPWAEEQAMEQLVALGYIDRPDAGREVVDRARAESEYYLARVHIHGGRPNRAVPLLERLAAAYPDRTRYATRLIMCYRDTGRLPEARTLLEQVRLQIGSLPTALRLVEASLLLADGLTEEAVQHLEALSTTKPPPPRTYTLLGHAYLSEDRFDEAAAAFRRVAELDPDDADARHGLAIVHLRKNEATEAVAEALRAVGLRFFFPAAHYALGQALMKRGDYRRAAEAMRIAVKQAPGMERAHYWLSEMCRNHLDEPENASRHFDAAYALRRASKSAS